MGLDMYLSKKIYVGAKHDHREVTGTIKLSAHGKSIPIDLGKVSYIVEEAGYWRKANQIHNWFVENVQDGLDECQETRVSYDQLMELKELCEKALETKDPKLLPPAEGFFFGSTEIDDYYWQDIKDTVEILKNLDPTAEYTYQSSW